MRPDASRRSGGGRTAADHWRSVRPPPPHRLRGEHFGICCLPFGQVQALAFHTAHTCPAAPRAADRPGAQHRVVVAECDLGDPHLIGRVHQRRLAGVGVGFAVGHQCALTGLGRQHHLGAVGVLDDPLGQGDLVVVVVLEVEPQLIPGGQRVVVEHAQVGVRRDFDDGAVVEGQVHAGEDAVVGLGLLGGLHPVLVGWVMSALFRLVRLVGWWFRLIGEAPAGAADTPAGAASHPLGLQAGVGDLRLRGGPDVVGDGHRKYDVVAVVRPVSGMVTTPELTVTVPWLAVDGEVISAEEDFWTV